MLSSIHPTLRAVTDRIIDRSARLRGDYLRMCDQMAERPRGVDRMGCANVAHALAAATVDERLRVLAPRSAHLGIVTAYNDMLSAHKPYENYPAKLRALASAEGASAQVAGGVPAMCDGITQGYEGMELSLFSRDVIAIAAAIALSHDVFDGALMLGVCDKIVPGLLIGAAQFGHLPVVFVPAGPMPSGLSNEAKSAMRQRHVMGEVDRATLLEAEQSAYHAPGTCTFYGTANSNQMLLEIMGLQLPGSSFVNPGTLVRDRLDAEAVRVAVSAARSRDPARRMARVLSERAVVNGMVGLHATGGSTNHTIHLIAIARSAGILIDWDDFAELSRCVPLLARVYPNGKADVNDFHAAGGMPFLIGELLFAGLLHEDVDTILGPGLSRFAEEPFIEGEGVRQDEGNPTGGSNRGNGADGRTGVTWRPVGSSSDESVLRGVAAPFAPEGGLRVIQGRIGRAVVKTSAVPATHQRIVAPALIFDSQEQIAARHREGGLQRDFVAVLRGQGPGSNGMPELHKLTPILGALQDQGFRVALLTDGRMSGASGKVLSAIHLSPDSARGGAILKLREGDVIEIDCEQGVLEVVVDDSEWALRLPAILPDRSGVSIGRGLFKAFRDQVSASEEGASILFGSQSR
jgi:phosphogluconate dehydratase